MCDVCVFSFQKRKNKLTVICHGASGRERRQEVRKRLFWLGEIWMCEAAVAELSVLSSPTRKSVALCVSVLSGSPGSWL